MTYFINKMLYFKDILDCTDWSSISKSSWIHGGSNSLFFAFAHGTRGWRTNSCFLMCRDGTSSKEGKKERGDGVGVRGRRRVKQQSKPCRATTVARTSLFTNGPSRRRRCFNVAVLHRGRPSSGPRLFTFPLPSVWNPQRGRKWP